LRGGVRSRLWRGIWRPRRPGLAGAGPVSSPPMSPGGRVRARVVRVRTWAAAMAVLGGLVWVATTIGYPERATKAAVSLPPAIGIHKIQHVVIIMQENRSFDSYFGTYPGADGIPRRNGRISVCVRDAAGHCHHPFHDPRLRNGEGPHGTGDTVLDVDHGRMDGFLRQSEKH